MQIVQIIAPVEKSISLVDAKGFLRVLESDDDVVIQNIIDAVEEHTQNVLNRQLEIATYELYTDDFIFKLPKNPIVSVDKIEYMDESGAYVVLDSTTYYLYEKNGIGFISYSEIPLIKEYKKAVKITFVAGYETVPKPIKSYMRVKIANYYENREEYVIGVSSTEVANGFIDNLIKPYRVRP